jgi:hypothetical protein
MSLLFLKIILTPLLIASATLIARRWGPAVGGWFVGLPLTSGPVSLFLALEQGTEFAAASAANSLVGLCGIAVFCVIYAKSARGTAWLRSCCFGLAVYFPAMEALSWPSPGLPLECVLTFGFQLAALLIIGKPPAAVVMRASPWWDLPLRMGMAVTLVLAITGFAVALGPKWSGLLAPVPAFTRLLTVFAHQRHGPAAAHQLSHGVIVGAFGAISFFCVVAFSLTSLSIMTTFVLATIAAFTTNGLILALMLRRRS